MLGLGAVSGLTTGVAYVGFFTTIGHGRISIVVPISAAVTALLPAVVGIAEGNVLSTLALGWRHSARWWQSRSWLTRPRSSDAGDGWSTARQVVVSILCGVGFGIYFFCIGHTHRSSGLWPTVASLVVGIVVIAPLAARGGVMPAFASLSRLAVAGGVALGLADVSPDDRAPARAADVASVLGNLYPLVTIALGVAVLGERVRSWHAVGILLAVAGVAMIAAG